MGKKSQKETLENCEGVESATTGRGRPGEGGGTPHCVPLDTRGTEVALGVRELCATKEGKRIRGHRQGKGGGST